MTAELALSSPLATAEQRISRGLTETWCGLRDVYAGKLWEGQGYDSFDHYCLKRWQISDKHGYRLAAAADLVDELAPHDIQLPNERTARALLDVAPEKRLPVVLLAHRASEGKLDSGWVVSASTVVEQIESTGGHVDDGNGGMVNATAAVVEERLERIQRQREHIHSQLVGDNNKYTKLFQEEVAIDHMLDQSFLVKLDDATEAAWNKNKEATVRIIVYLIEPKQESAS